MRVWRVCVTIMVARLMLEVLAGQRDLLAAEPQRMQMRRALLSSHVSLYAALGDDSQEFVASYAP